MASRGWRRYAAPAAFMLAATVVVLLIRSGLRSGSTTRSPSIATTTVSRPTAAFWTVRAGDTFGVISAKTGVSVARLEQLNPKVRSTSLFIGQRIRLR